MSNELPAHMRPERSFQGLILALQRYWADYGCVILQPYDMEVGAGTFHPATTLARARAEALERGLCAAFAPAEGRPLRREPQPAAALLPVPGDPEAVAPPTCRTSTSSRSYAIGIDPEAARHPLRRGRLGIADARRLGARLGMLVRRHGGVAVHLLPAGRGLRMRAGLGRVDLWPRAAGDVRAGRRPRLRSQLQRPRGRQEGHLRRRVPAGREGIFAAQFRTSPTPTMLFEQFRMAEAACRKYSTPAGPRGQRAPPPDGAAGLRPVHQGEPCRSICSTRVA